MEPNNNIGLNYECFNTISLSVFRMES